jgi:xanthine dehydrogenase molybdopterin-binding subunit B
MLVSIYSQSENTCHYSCWTTQQVSRNKEKDKSLAAQNKKNQMEGRLKQGSQKSFFLETQITGDKMRCGAKMAKCIL